MLARCNNCGNFITRYMENTYSDPCGVCGKYIFWITHLGLPYTYGHTPTHEFLYDVKEKIKLTEDICDD